MSSGSGRGWWIAAEVAAYVLVLVVPSLWVIFGGAIVALLLPFVMLAIWHWSSPEQKQRLYNPEGTNPQNQKGPLEKKKERAAN
jgi:hypothetical protein